MKFIYCKKSSLRKTWFFLIAFLIIFLIFPLTGANNHKSFDGENNTIKDSIGDDDSVIIGDERTPEFENSVKFSRWDNDTHLRVGYQGDGSFGSPVTDGNKTTSSNNKESVNLYKIENDKFEFEIVLNKKPAKNKWEFNLEGWEDFNFIYQPPLNDGINNNLCNSTHCGQTYRPSNVVGSYAVYHKTKKNNQYKTGKAFHIYRPKLIDAKGNEEWCDMNFSKGILSIGCNETWLGKMEYPVILDPTIGVTTEGASGYYQYASEIYFVVDNATIPTNGNLDTIFIYYDSGAGNSDVQMAVYTNSSGRPLTLVGNTSNFKKGSTYLLGWFNKSIAGSLSSGTSYWIAATFSGSNTAYQYDTGPQNTSLINTTGHGWTFGTPWPATFPTTTATGTYKFSFYVNYSTTPTITIQSPTNTTYNLTAVVLSVTASEAITTWNFSNNTQSNIVFNNNMTLNVTQGSNNYTICGSDGTNMNCSRLVFAVETLRSPNITIQSPTNTTYNLTAVVLSVTADKAVTWNFSNNTQSNIIFNNNMTLNVTQGSNNYTICGTAGTLMNCSRLVFSVDSIAPTITIQSPTNTTYNLTAVVLSVTASEAITTWNFSNNTQSNIVFNNNMTLNVTQGSNNYTICGSDGTFMNCSRLVFAVETLRSPNITIQSPTNTTYNLTAVVLSVTADKSVTWNFSSNIQSNIVFNNNITLNITGGSNQLTVCGTAGTFMNCSRLVFTVSVSSIPGIMAFIRSGSNNPPAYRFYNTSTNQFNLTGHNATNTGSAQLEHVWLKCAPNRYECALATADTVDDLHIQFYSSLSNGTLCWNNGTECGRIHNLTTTLVAASGEKASLEYENSTGDLIMVWANNSEDGVMYERWNGTHFAFGAVDPVNPDPKADQLILSALNTTGTPEWIETAQEPGTDNISIIYSTDLDRMGVLMWTGSSNSWGCELLYHTDPKMSLVPDTTAPRIDIVHEMISGDTLALIGNGSFVNIYYFVKPKGSCTYSGLGNFSTSKNTQADTIRAFPVWGTDRIGIITQDKSGSVLEWLQWNGTNFSDNSPTIASTGHTPGNQFASGGCVRGSDKCIVTYSSSNTLTDIAGSSLVPSTDTWTDMPNFTTNMTTNEEAIQCYSYPEEIGADDKVLCIFEDDENDLWAYTYDNSLNNWTATNQTPGAFETSTFMTEFRSFAFDFITVSDTKAPNITILSPTNQTYNLTAVVLSVTADKAVTWNFSNNTQSNILFNSNMTLNTTQGSNNYTICGTAGTLMNCSRLVFTVETARSPNITIQSPTNTTYNLTAVVLSVTADKAVTWNFSNNTQSNIIFDNNMTLNTTQGSNNYTVCGTAGTLMNCSRLVFSVDTTAPTITIQSPTNTTYNLTGVVLSVTANEAITAWNFSNNTQSNIVFNNNMTLNVTQGSNNYTVCGSDGTNMNCSRLVFSVDTTTPFIAFVTGTESNNTYMNRTAVNVTVNVNDANEKNATFTLYNSSGLVNSTLNSTPAQRSVNWTHKDGGGLKEGVYSYNVTTCDLSNLCNSTENRTITLDRTPPTVTLTTPSSGSTKTSASVTFTYSADDIALTNCSLIVDNSIVQTNSSPSIGSNTFTRTLSSAAHTWNINCTDKINSTSTNTSISFTVSVASTTTSSPSSSTESTSRGGSESVSISEKTPSNVQSSSISRSYFSIPKDIPIIIPASIEFKRATGLKEVYLMTNREINDVQIKIKSVAREDIAEIPDYAYKYFSIESLNFEDKDVKESEIRIEIEKELFEKNNYNTDDVNINRYINGEWVNLDTSLTEELLGSYIFSAKTQGFENYSVYTLTLSSTNKIAEKVVEEEEIRPGIPIREKIDITVNESRNLIIFGASLLILIIIIAIVLIYLTILSHKKYKRNRNNYFNKSINCF